MICAQCGTTNPADSRFCFRCGRPLAGAPGAPAPAAAPQASDDPLVAKVIPYRNVPALIGYYCGVFGLVPCFGVVLGPISFILGLFGLHRAERTPESGGRAHAWVALVLGLVDIAINVGMFIWMRNL